MNEKFSESSLPPQHPCEVVRNSHSELSNSVNKTHLVFIRKRSLTTTFLQGFIYLNTLKYPLKPIKRHNESFSHSKSWEIFILIRRTASCMAYQSTLTSSSSYFHAFSYRTLIHNVARIFKQEIWWPCSSLHKMNWPVSHYKVGLSLSYYLAALNME
jgi:hypothetical protein